MTFTEWLVAQQERQDIVGKLAAHAAADKAWPHDADYRGLIEHLVESLSIDDLFAFAPALQQAAREHASVADAA